MRNILEKVTKSSLIDNIIRSTGGGFGAELKSAGFDILIVEGKDLEEVL